MEENQEGPIALVLSGGGVRAMVFHLGVLKYMAERHMLERVQKISTVSGGSLIVGLIMQCKGGPRWPTSDEFLKTVYPTLKTRLCGRSMIWGAVRRLWNPLNWRFLLSRANLLALTLKHEWGVIEELAALPVRPEWSINGTTAENGKRFRFKQDSIGDYLIGYAEPGAYPLASAMAVSAAFPGGFGPLALLTKQFTWKRRAFGAPIESEVVVKQDWKRIHLYDGGVYDNLGLEPFFDAGKGVAKPKAMPIIVSDAGAPLAAGFDKRALNPFRLLRILNIISEQSRSLRVRTFATFLQGAPARGAYIYINEPVGSPPNESSKSAASFPTTLSRLTSKEFDMLAGHGYQVTAKVDRAFGLVSAQGATHVLG